MNSHALIPLVATIAYVPLLVVLFGNRPWDNRQRLFLMFLMAAFLWSFTDFFARSDFLMQDKLLIARVVICIVIWMVIQLHYFLCCFYRPQRARIPVAYGFLLSTVVLTVLGYVPQSIEITPGGFTVHYGVWLLAIALVMVVALGGRDMYYLARRHRVSPDPTERNQIAYLLFATASIIAFLLSSFAPGVGAYPFAHIGNFVVACILSYAVIAHRLLDVRVVLRRALGYLGIY
ncbi:MAG: hypothetical protein KAU10_06215, partial [Dehalococcoidia bacterium]|nr:hypothetical protein [Dehalococcoidia bacterium]